LSFKGVLDYSGSSCVEHMVVRYNGHKFDPMNADVKMSVTASSEKADEID